MTLYYSLIISLIPCKNGSSRVTRQIKHRSDLFKYFLFFLKRIRSLFTFVSCRLGNNGELAIEYLRVFLPQQRCLLKGIAESRSSLMLHIYETEDSLLLLLVLEIASSTVGFSVAETNAAGVAPLVTFYLVDHPPDRYLASELCPLMAPPVPVLPVLDDLTFIYQSLLKVRQRLGVVLLVEPYLAFSSDFSQFFEVEAVELSFYFLLEEVLLEVADCFPHLLQLLFFSC